MTARDISAPAPGFFKRRLVKGGVYVAARIWRPCACTVNGPDEHDWRETCDRYPQLAAQKWDMPPTFDPIAVHEVWTWQPTTEADYRYLMGLRTWAQNFAPMDPFATPEKLANINQLKAPF